MTSSPFNPSAAAGFVSSMYKGMLDADVKVSARRRYVDPLEPCPVPGDLIYPGCGWVFVRRVATQEKLIDPRTGRVSIIGGVAVVHDRIAFVVSMEREIDFSSMHDGAGRCSAFCVVDGSACEGWVERMEYDNTMLRWV